MTFELLFILLIILIGFIVLAWFLQRQLKNMSLVQNEAKILEDVVHKVFGLTSAQLAQQSKQILSSEKEIIQTDLTNKQQSIQKLVENLQQDLKDRQTELRQIEQERGKTLSGVKQAIESHQEITKQLQATTESLSKILRNNQQRGQWGEHILEDLLQHSGFIEGVHYVRQQKLGSSADRPDITLLLPNQRVVPIDVKFPLSEVIKLSEAPNKEQKELHKKQLARDIKIKIQKVETYIKPEEDTLDYAILFVPNEMLFSYINQQFPELISQAMDRKVMLVSPFTFMIVARTIRESYRNFMIESNLRKIIKDIQEFVKQWEMFIKEFESIGSGIEKLEQVYRQIRDTRHRQLTKRMEKIEEFGGSNTIGIENGELRAES